MLEWLVLPMSPSPEFAIFMFQDFKLEQPLSIVFGVIGKWSDSKTSQNPQLVGGLEHVSCFHLLGTIIPIDYSNMFQRGTLNHQPDRLDLFSVFWGERFAHSPRSPEVCVVQNRVLCVSSGLSCEHPGVSAWMVLVEHPYMLHGAGIPSCNLT